MLAATLSVGEVLSVRRRVHPAEQADAHAATSPGVTAARRCTFQLSYCPVMTPKPILNR